MENKQGDNNDAEKNTVFRPRTRRERRLWWPFLAAQRRGGCGIAQLPAAVLGMIFAFICVQFPDTPLHNFVGEILDRYELPWIDHGFQGKVHEVTFTLEDEKAVLGVRMWEIPDPSESGDESGAESGDESGDASDDSGDGSGIGGIGNSINPKQDDNAIEYLAHVFLDHPLMYEFLYSFAVKDGDDVYDFLDPRSGKAVLSRLDLILNDDFFYHRNYHADVIESYAMEPLFPGKDNDLLLLNFSSALQALAVCNMNEAQHQIAIRIQRTVESARRLRLEISRLTREIADSEGALQSNLRTVPSFVNPTRRALDAKKERLDRFKIQEAQYEQRLQKLRLELRALDGAAAMPESGNSTCLVPHEPGPAPGNRCPVCNRIIVGEGGTPGAPCFTCWQRQREDGGAGGAGGGDV
jgi:hypothetical protein